jgi:hypothetical protein
MSDALNHSGEFVVWADGPDGRVYLDDTGTGTRDLAEAKKFRDEVDAKEGLFIADLAPTGVSGEWRIERLAQAPSEPPP